MTEGTARIFVLCGEAGTGKTTLCLQTAALLQKGYVRVAGIVSPARFEGERKTGIFVQDIRSGERCLLAVPGNENGLGWRFDPDALYPHGDGGNQPEGCPGGGGSAGGVADGVDARPRTNPTA